MTRCSLTRVVLLVSLNWSSPALAVDFFWTGPDIGGPGGNFRQAQYWTFTPPPFPLDPAPGGAGDTANFDLSRDPENRYTVTNVQGENDRLIVHDDSLTLVIPDVNIGSATDYVLSNDTATSPSLTIGVALGDVADVILAGGGGRAVIGTQSTTIGRAAFSTGILTVTDELRWLGSGELMVGESGSGTLTIQNGAVVSSNQGLLGLNEGLGFFGSGTVLVTGAGSNWNMDQGLGVGLEGAGTLTIEAGGSVSNVVGSIGVNSSDATGEVTVAGAGSTWTNSDLLQIGVFGSATMTIAGGGMVSNTSSNLAFNEGSSATVTVSGAGSQWINSDDLDVGLRDVANLTIADGGHVTNVLGRVGINDGSTGTVNVTGAGSTWTNSDELRIGYAGDGTLVISDGASVSNTLSYIGFQPASTGDVSVTGAGSTWTNSGAIRVGHEGAGELTTDAGGSVTTSSVFIAFLDDSDGEVTVTGAGSTLTSDLQINVGGLGTGHLTISDGGHVTSGFSGSVGANPGSTGTALVTGTGSAWNIDDDLTVGFFGTGTLNVQNSASVSSASGFLGRIAGSTGTVTVSGFSTPGSTWEISGRLSIAGHAPTGAAGGTGTLNISSGGTVDVAEDTVLFPNGLVRLQGGTFGTSAINFEGGGQFQWTSGTLHVGVYEGNLTNPSGGTLAPGRSAGSTTVLGDYTQSAGATLEIEIGGTATATEFDFVNVTGTAVMGGTLELALINDFLPNPDDEFVIFNAEADLLSFFTNAGNGQRVDTVDGIGSFLIHYGPTSAFDPDQIVLNEFELAPLPGDYNQDGRVNAADYTVWRNNLGSPTALPNDDSPGVGPDDYDRWKTHFGQTLGSGSGATGSASAAVAEVPEPAAALLLAMGLVLAAALLCQRSASPHCRR
jgi:T5SS/PEP-CTERM-associated repeat protein